MRFGASAVVLAAILWAFPAGAGTEVAPRDSRLGVVQLLHDARFGEAEEALADGGPVPPGPERDFLRAFVLYWRLLYDDDNDTLRSAFEARLARALDSSQERLGESPGDAEALLWSGTAHLFLAELRASEKRPIAAAGEARRARRALSAIPDDSPSRIDASFGLGTVDVLADELPAFARGLSSFMGLSGDRERGLRELERAAAGRLFALESRLFLLSVRSSRKKRDYSEALAEARRVADLVPRSVAALDGAARVRTMLGDARAARVDVEAALAIVARAPRTDRQVIASLLIQGAKADLALFRPDLAAERLRALQDLGLSLPRAARKEAADVVRVISQAMPPPPWSTNLVPLLGIVWPEPVGAGPAPAVESWRRAIPALDLERDGLVMAAADDLERLASERADDPVLALLAGRGELLAGRATAARARLALAARSPSLPKAWLGPCLLLEGRAADLEGDRPAAIALYRRATEAPAFVDREAAWLHLTVPYGGLS